MATSTMTRLLHDEDDDTMSMWLVMMIPTRQRFGDCCIGEDNDKTSSWLLHDDGDVDVNAIVWWRRGAVALHAPHDEEGYVFVAMAEW
jgi:hypothetical protein